MAALEIVLAQVGPRHVAIPRSHVRHIARMPASFGYRGAGVADQLVALGRPWAYVSLWDRLGVASTYEPFAELHHMLRQRRQDHIDWLAALEQSITAGVPFTKARDPRACAFGRWYYSFQTEVSLLTLSLTSFNTPHVRIHALAEVLLAQAAAGDLRGAQRRLEEARSTILRDLLQMFDVALGVASALQRRVAVVVEHRGWGCALGVDQVVNLLRVPAAQQQRGRTRDQEEQQLCLLDGGAIASVLDWRAMLARAAPAGAGAGDAVVAG